MILFADSTLMIPKCIKFKISLTMKINLTMKLFRIIILLLSLQAIVNAQDMKGMDMTKKENVTQAQPVTYTCIMHPEIHATKPGKCPKCGMDLIVEKSKKAKPKKAKPKKTQASHEKRGEGERRRYISHQNEES